MTKYFAKYCIGFESGETALYDTEAECLTFLKTLGRRCLFTVYRKEVP